MEYSSNDEENFQIGINKLAKKLNAFNILGKIKNTLFEVKFKNLSLFLKRR